MKKYFLFISAVLIATTVFQIDVLAQETSSKVYWMITAEVPLGKLASYHAFNQKELRPVQEKYGYNFIGSWQTIVGDIEQVISIAEFDNMEAYNKARVAFLGSEEWKTSLGSKVDSFLKSIETRFLRALSYSSIK
jgi:hypothetical protein